MLAPTGRPPFRANCGVAHEHVINTALLQLALRLSCLPTPSITLGTRQNTANSRRVGARMEFYTEVMTLAVPKASHTLCGAALHRCLQSRSCLGIVGGRHGVGAVEVEQVRDASQHSLLRARASAAPEVVQPAAWCDPANHTWTVQPVSTSGWATAPRNRQKVRLPCHSTTEGIIAAAAPSKGDWAPPSLLFTNPASMTVLARRLSVATVVGYLR